MSGPDSLYPALNFTPVVSRFAHEFVISEFRISRRETRYQLENLPLALAIPQAALKDAVYWTFELDGMDEADTDGDVLRESHLLALTLSDGSERFTLEIRAIERPDIPEMLFFEYRDSSDDWRPLEDVLFYEVLPDGFVNSLEALVMDALESSDVDLLNTVLDYAE